jgi:hypothetical protein
MDRVGPVFKAAPGGAVVLLRLPVTLSQIAASAEGKWEGKCAFSGGVFDGWAREVFRLQNRCSAN